MKRPPAWFAWLVVAFAVALAAVMRFWGDAGNWVWAVAVVALVGAGFVLGDETDAAHHPESDSPDGSEDEKTGKNPSTNTATGSSAGVDPGPSASSSDRSERDRPDGDSTSAQGSSGHSTSSDSASSGGDSGGGGN